MLWGQVENSILGRGSPQDSSGGCPGLCLREVEESRCAQRVMRTQKSFPNLGFYSERRRPLQLSEQRRAVTCLMFSLLWLLNGQQPEVE